MEKYFSQNSKQNLVSKGGKTPEIVACTAQPTKTTKATVAATAPGTTTNTAKIVKKSIKPNELRIVAKVSSGHLLSLGKPPVPYGHVCKSTIPTTTTKVTNVRKLKRVAQVDLPVKYGRVGPSFAEPPPGPSEGRKSKQKTRLNQVQLCSQCRLQVNKLQDLSEETSTDNFSTDLLMQNYIGRLFESPWYAIDLKQIASLAATSSSCILRCIHLHLCRAHQAACQDIGKRIF